MKLGPKRFAVALAGGLFFACFGPALAQDQNAQQKAVEKSPEEQAREAQLQAMKEFAEAAKLPKNVGSPECLWLGRRVVSLLYRDDPDAAKRFIDLYDRFGCSGDYLKVAFRCVIRMGPLDQKVPQRLSARVHMCWINPDSLPSPQ